MKERQFTPGDPATAPTPARLSGSPLGTSPDHSRTRWQERADDCFSFPAQSGRAGREQDPVFRSRARVL